MSQLHERGSIVKFALRTRINQQEEEAGGPEVNSEQLHSDGMG